jgi:hypothetical protein
MTGADRGSVRIRFLVPGIVFGVLWYANRDTPLWEHAVRMLVIMVVVLAAIELLADRHNGQKRAPHLAHGRVIGAKLGLLAIAVVAEWALDHWTEQASAVVAVGLVVVTAVVGPALRHHCVRASVPR